MEGKILKGEARGGLVEVTRKKEAELRKVRWLFLAVFKTPFFHKAVSRPFPRRFVCCFFLLLPRLVLLEMCGLWAGCGQLVKLSLAACCACCANVRLVSVSARGKVQLLCGPSLQP